MPITNPNIINPEIQDYFAAFGLSSEKLSADSIRVILTYAIFGYLHKRKSQEFLIEVARALHKQTTIPLTLDVLEVIKKLEQLQTSKKDPKEMKLFYAECMDTLLL